ncbi:helix-hairpin-helix domain-containing protein [Macrococcus carouselicus]|nr:helix-hairpin-helix domain-containing protein [Macrococcus carouselicus]
MKELFAEHKMKIGVLVVILLAGLFVYQSSLKPPVEPLETLAQEEKSIETTTEMPGKKEMMIDIKGAVKYAGVYAADDTKRVVDMLELAQPLKNADTEAVNLSLQLSDQMVIYVPYKGEVKEEKYMMYSQTAGGNSSSDSKIININTATESELQEIPGIGPKKAADILLYREQHNGFKSKEEMKEIKGIGDKTYVTLEPFIEL